MFGNMVETTDYFGPRYAVMSSVPNVRLRVLPRISRYRGKYFEPQKNTAYRLIPFACCGWLIAVGVGGAVLIG